jgi:hypothetical protein
MTAVARPVTLAEVGALLSPFQAQALRNALAEDVAELIESGHRVHDLACWLDDGILEVYARDELETEAGAGGSLLCETVMPGPSARCVTCGRIFAGGRPWCSQHCRVLLRNEGRRMFPESLDDDVLRGAVRWAQRERNTRLGWTVPITRNVAERLYDRGDPPGDSAKPNGTRWVTFRGAGRQSRTVRVQSD